MSSSRPTSIEDKHPALATLLPADTSCADIFGEADADRPISTFFDATQDAAAGREFLRFTQMISLTFCPNAEFYALPAVRTLDLHCRVLRSLCAALPGWPGSRSVTTLRRFAEGRVGRRPTALACSQAGIVTPIPQRRPDGRRPEHTPIPHLSVEAIHTLPPI